MVTLALLLSIYYNGTNVWMVSLWLHCLIKWLEKSDWLQGWCIIDERAWLIENILRTRGGCVRAWAYACVRLKEVASFSVSNLISWCTTQLFDWYSAQELTSTRIGDYIVHIGRVKVGSYNLKQSTKCQLELHKSRYLCRETEMILHICSWWSPYTCDSSWAAK